MAMPICAAIMMSNSAVSQTDATRGNREARIFCQKLEAELVAIAGQYRVSEQLESSSVTGPAQVYLLDKKLLIESI